MKTKLRLSHEGKNASIFLTFSHIYDQFWLNLAFCEEMASLALNCANTAPVPIASFHNLLFEIQISTVVLQILQLRIFLSFLGG